MIYILLLTAIATPMAFIRNIAHFSFTYLLGVLLIVWCLLMYDQTQAVAHLPVTGRFGVEQLSKALCYQEG